MSSSYRANFDELSDLHSSIFTMGFFRKFKEFIENGNVVDLAIAFILATSGRVVVKSFVDDLFLPVVSVLFDAIGISTGRFENYFITLKDGPGAKAGTITYNTLDEAKEDDAITINHGAIFVVLIDFFLIAIFCFMLASAYLRTVTKKEEHNCNECLEPVNEKAIRCKHCTCILAPVQDKFESDMESPFPILEQQKMKK